MILSGLLIVVAITFPYSIMVCAFQSACEILTFCTETNTSLTRPLILVLRHGFSRSYRNLEVICRTQTRLRISKNREKQTLDPMLSGVI